MRGSPLLGVLAIGAPFVVGAFVVSNPIRPDLEVFTFTDPEIVESSGLVARDGLAYTVNDSGDTGRVFAVDPETGDTVGTTAFDPDAEDVEALAPAGPREVWVGDIGDNRRQRSEITVTRVPVGQGERTDAGTAVRLIYPGGARDAEALLVHPQTGRLFVVSKGALGGQVYAAPRELDESAPNRLAPRGPVLGMVTDGSFFPDGRHLMLRSYGRAVVYHWPSLEPEADLELPRQRQGEGLAVTEDGEVLLSSEGREAPVLRLPLPDDVQAALEDEPQQSAQPERTSARDVTAEARDQELRPYLIGGGILLGVVAVAAAVRHWRHGAHRRSR